MRDQVASLARPVKELKAFGRLDLAAGEAKRVTFEIPTDMLNFTGLNGSRRVEPGRFELMIGASSGDIRLTAVVELTGEISVLKKRWRMESSFAAGPVAG